MMAVQLFPTTLRSKRMLVVALLCVVGLLVVGPGIKRVFKREIRRQIAEQTALAALQPKLASVEFASNESWATWVGRWLGYEYGGRTARSVSFGEFTLRDQDLDELVKLPALASIELYPGPYSPAAISRLLALPNLQRFRVQARHYYLGEARPTTGSLQPQPAIALPGLPPQSPAPADGYLDFYPLTALHFDAAGQATQLQELALVDVAIEPTFLARLPLQSRLQKLELSGTRLTDAVLQSLPAWPALTELRVRRTQLTGVGLERFVNLQTLDLGENELTCEAIVPLRQLARLQTLYLDETPLDETWIEALAALDALCCLYITAGALKPPALQRLKQLRPTLQVVEVPRPKWPTTQTPFIPAEVAWDALPAGEQNRFNRPPVSAPIDFLRPAVTAQQPGPLRK